MHRCCPCHSGWKSQTAGLAYVQMPVLSLFKYILRGFCVLMAANLLCATTVFWSGGKNGSCQDPSIVMVWLCPGEPCRWPLSSVRGQTSFPAHLALALPLHLAAESLMGWVHFASAAGRCCSSFKPTDCIVEQAVSRSYFLFTSPVGLKWRGHYALHSCAYKYAWKCLHTFSAWKKHSTSVILAGLHLRYWVKGKYVLMAKCVGKKVGCDD